MPSFTMKPTMPSFPVFKPAPAPAPGLAGHAGAAEPRSEPTLPSKSKRLGAAAARAVNVARTLRAGGKGGAEAAVAAAAAVGTAEGGRRGKRRSSRPSSPETTASRPGKALSVIRSVALSSKAGTAFRLQALSKSHSDIALIETRMNELAELNELCGEPNDGYVKQIVQTREEMHNVKNMLNDLQLAEDEEAAGITVSSASGCGLFVCWFCCVWLPPMTWRVHVMLAGEAVTSRAARGYQGPVGHCFLARAVGQHAEQGAVVRSLVLDLS